MALRKIALEGETCLSKVCRPVTDFNSRLHTLLDDLADTLADSGGVGLAAPQVGVLRRVCVVLDEEDQLIELVNPEIIYKMCIRDRLYAAAAGTDPHGSGPAAAAGGGLCTRAGICSSG